MLERDVEKEIVRYAEKRGCIVIKLNGPGDRGKPDRVFFYKGRCLFIEMKKPGEKPTVIQADWLRKFQEAGFVALVADNPGKGKTMVDNFIRQTDMEKDGLTGLFDRMRDALRRLRGKQPLDMEKLAELSEQLEIYSDTPEDF